MNKSSLLNQSQEAAPAFEGVGLSTMPQSQQDPVATAGGEYGPLSPDLAGFVSVKRYKPVTRTLRNKIDGTLKTVVVVELPPSVRSMLRLKSKLKTNTNNWKAMKGFLTLTYKDDTIACMNDLREFLNTIQMTLKRSGKGKLNYVWKVEWGEENGRLHYHLIFDKFIPKAWLKKWRHGLTEVRKIKNPRMARYYVSKYISKDTEKPPTWNGRLWSTSRGWAKASENEWESIRTQLGEFYKPLTKCPNLYPTKFF